ncbi:PAS domain S-box-containing protein/diguanylate cyclase (GGDEF) domain-containing protein [Roseomonas rosea]|uniref:PAS domain S-box-containing protein/diguanylate cyclase (GGDEF) domain-containing protein n=1 Tax=Muricoccus roseus TaxID=198092 RepID=A0A1M6CIB1_9PROT|nr:EAL domain-containing protein [Roseomonas rosea]SHI60643.1 PAS domain S-box-containing protein/diguanylate cyclase (GGDEF) domain-containing protein [Roseomonas rosea]
MQPAGENDTPGRTGEEAARQLAVAAYQASGVEPGADLDQIAEMAANIFEAPMALINLLTANELLVVARHGCSFQSVPRQISFCTHTIQHDAVLVVPDTASDIRFARNPLVTEGPTIRFYAGAPLVSPLGGHRIGTVCILDTKPRPPLDERQRNLLQSLAAMVMDRMEMRRLDGARRDGLARFSRVTAALPSAVICADDAGRVTHWNEAAERLFGWTAEEAVGGPADRILPASDRASHAARLLRLSETGGSPNHAPIEVTVQRRDGGVFLAEMTLACWREGNGHMASAAILRDVTQRRQAERRLRHLAHHDPLTGLANRVLLSEALQRSPRSSPCSLILLDLDGLKHVNDAFGHEVGDALLQEAATLMERCLDRRGLLARLGGDEFAVLLRGDAAMAAAIEAELRETLATESFRLRDRNFRLLANTGYATAPGLQADTLLANADLALHRAKAQGSGTGLAYQPAMRAEYQARRTLEEELERAVENGEFTLFYQPQIRLADGRMTGAEALLRWHHPSRGLLAPGAFLHVLEASPLAGRVGDWALDQACRQGAAWRGAGLPLRIGVNLFAEQLRLSGLDGKVEAALRRHGLPPTALELELTETIVLRKADSQLEPLRRLHAMGTGIALDDFGTGYASLSTLKRFPLTRLKIDRSFVTEIATDRHDGAIVEALLSLGRNLGLEVIAEGIETVEQEAALRGRGCEAGQGYLYGQPMPPDELLALAQARHAA